jgi:predicted homoserine dehydrogenase-like protein
MGDGPLYAFYTPYHLCNFEVPITAARAVLFGDAAIAPRGAPVCEVLTCAKRPLRAGELLDGIGGFTTYGVLENRDIFETGEFLPMGLSEGCRVIRDMARDEPIARCDVEFPAARLADRLRAEQTQMFPAVTRSTSYA